MFLLYVKGDVIKISYIDSTKHLLLIKTTTTERKSKWIFTILYVENDLFIYCLQYPHTHHALRTTQLQTIKNVHVHSPATLTATSFKIVCQS